MDRPKNLNEALKAILSEEESAKVPKSFNTIGDIAVFEEFPEDMIPKEGIIAEALMKVNKNIKTVLRKSSEVSGEFRVYRTEFMGGERKTETVHKESGCLFKLDVEKVYFNPRQGTERERLSKKIHLGKILVMFAGVCPFPIVIAKKNPNVEIVAIELNPFCTPYSEENLKKNKVQERVKFIEGDVREVCKALPQNSFDYVIMPGPKIAEIFLDVAFQMVSPGGKVEYYTFASEAEFEDVKRKIHEEAEKAGKSIEITEIKNTLPHAPRVYLIAVEIKVKN